MTRARARADTSALGSAAAIWRSEGPPGFNPYPYPYPYPQPPTPTPTPALALTPTLTPSRSEGPSGFYRGFSAHYVRVRPHARHAALAWAWG